MVDSDLLRVARRTFFPLRGPDLEADLWHSPFVASANAAGFIFHEDFASFLRSAMAPDKWNRVRELFESRRGWLPILTQLEEAVRVAQTGPNAEEAVDRWLTWIRDGVDSGTLPNVAAQISNRLGDAPLRTWDHDDRRSLAEDTAGVAAAMDPVRRRALRVVVLCPHFEPDTAPTGMDMSRLVAELALLGHELHVVTSLPWYEERQVAPGWEGRWVRTESTKWGSVSRVHPFPGSRGRTWDREQSGLLDFQRLWAFEPYELEACFAAPMSCSRCHPL